MVAIFVLLFVLTCVGIEYVRGRVAERNSSFATRPEIFYHEPSFMPTPTMADGGELVEKTEK